jgi:alpha-tubulin suppressor-like RCC1 family protein/DNA-directed RNA polymerase subunit RPC12/RpoP
MIMAIFKCKMCGGELDVDGTSTVVTCDYCGTKQTVPTSNDEEVLNLFNRANSMRLRCDFDKAEQVYERVISKDNKQAEAYWGVLLCKYGIEYVEDPKTGKRVPTCHRTSFDAITADEYYKLALDNADGVQRGIYESEAKYIDGVQKEILAISQKEEPYDVFICYKETDENGKRTQDSVIANDIYYQLTQEGYKVFYAAITLEDKLGSAYEPIIFAALNSAKVMLSIGTKPEYFTAVWVKNEWSRYLKLMQKDRTKMLIPCYKDMDAYDLPEEFAHLQAQDMGKIGFINDIVRGIKKVIVKSKPEQKAASTASAVNGNVANLLKRAYMYAEDGDFENANIYAEKVLDIDSEFAEAYVVKLMCDLKVNKRTQLGNGATPFATNANYLKAIRFGDEKLKEEFNVYENERQYKRATELMYSQSESDIQNARQIFLSLLDLEDSKNLAEQCISLAENARKNEMLSSIRKKIAPYANMIIAKNNNTVGLNSDGTVNACGNNNEGQCNVSIWKGWKDIVAIASGEWHTVGLKSDGTVVIAGQYTDSQNYNVFEWHDIVAIAVARFTIVGLKSDGTVVTVGIKDSDGLDNVSQWRDIVAIAGLFDHTVGLKSNGTVVATGNLGVGGWKGIVSIAASDNQLIGLKSDGTVVATCGDVAEWKNIVAVAAGEHHSVGLKNDGTVVAAGMLNAYGECRVYDWKDVVAIAAGYEHTVGLKSDGTVVATGDNRKGQCNVWGWSDIVAIAAGDEHTVGIKSDGTVVAVGDNSKGQCYASKWRLFYTKEGLEKEKATLETELANLKGFFAGVKRNSIRGRLAEIDKELSKLK